MKPTSYPMDPATFQFLHSFLPVDMINEINTTLLAMYKEDHRKLLLTAMKNIIAIENYDDERVLNVEGHYIWLNDQAYCKKCGDPYDGVWNWINERMTEIPKEKNCRSHNKLCEI
nr:hypothetical protein K-LCC10_0244 [Kaumoebavirus]